ncbi:HAMP domain-containing sensor histidine kinase [Youngiibacter multivorans]|uniref:Heme sensor protein HssS n=1 Tax=Youngiibacter multivorans TaxID=937251 RepID=A0ABS4G0B2_9CLOT|nr:HAMP domain-containing sensor histidine kinase [Youngiibacter multivorans]MBP1917983.1 signal transduction histidine kinase [Youngiibacter multivorans]
MRKLFRFKSIYTKFTLLFLFVWWFLNSITFAVVAMFMRRTTFYDMTKVLPGQFQEFRELHSKMNIVFLISVVIGSGIILLAVKSIVKPIQKLSGASKEVASGNFDIQMKVESQDEIGRLTEDFNLMVTELRNIEHLRTDFVSNVSHEFRTPITSIRGYAKLIKNRDLSKDKHDEYADIIISESDRLSQLSSNLLKLSSLDSKAIPSQRTLFSLDEEIRKVILLLEPEWSRKELDLDVDLDDMNITGDRHLLYEVWLNLIQNAVKFTDKGGKMSVTLKRENGRVIFKTLNKGPSFNNEELKRIFERFYKGDTSHSSEGSGLGLAIARKIIETHNGTIKADSRDGFVTFTVELEE